MLMMVSRQVSSHVVSIRSGTQWTECSAKVTVLQTAVHVVVVSVDSSGRHGALGLHSVHIDSVHGGVCWDAGRVQVIAVVGSGVLDLDVVVMGTGRMMMLVLMTQIVFDVAAVVVNGRIG